MMGTGKKREEIIKNRSLVVDDISLPEDVIDEKCEEIPANSSIKDDPKKVLPLSHIDEKITDSLIGKRLDVSLSTKKRGRQLERVVAYMLGYKKKNSIVGWENREGCGCSLCAKAR